MLKAKKDVMLQYWTFTLSIHHNSVTFSQMIFPKWNDLKLMVTRSPISFRVTMLKEIQFFFPNTFSVTLVEAEGGAINEKLQNNIIHSAAS